MFALYECVRSHTCRIGIARSRVESYHKCQCWEIFFLSFILSIYFFFISFSLLIFAAIYFLPFIFSLKFCFYFNRLAEEIISHAPTSCTSSSLFGLPNIFNNIKRASNDGFGSRAYVKIWNWIFYWCHCDFVLVFFCIVFVYCSFLFYAYLLWGKGTTNLPNARFPSTKWEILKSLLVLFITGLEMDLYCGAHWTNSVGNFVLLSNMYIRVLECSNWLENISCSIDVNEKHTNT